MLEKSLRSLIFLFALAILFVCGCGEDTATCASGLELIDGVCVCPEGYREEGGTCVKDGMPFPFEDGDEDGGDVSVHPLLDGDEDESVDGDEDGGEAPETDTEAERADGDEDGTETDGDGAGTVTWIDIPEGSCSMGVSPDDDTFVEVERPAHVIELDAFRMTETEVTQAQFEAVMGFNPSTFDNSCPDCPVETVSRKDAQSFCQAVGGRLPSSAEWEYAARAGTTERYICGTSTACLSGLAWWNNAVTSPQAVGRLQENAWGLYDVLGNVFEWTLDCPHEGYQGAPGDGSVFEGGDCDKRVIRGGSYESNDFMLRVSNPAAFNESGTDQRVGFRCLQE